jgi:hypothetical protein
MTTTAAVGWPAGDTQPEPTSPDTHPDPSIARVCQVLDRSADVVGGVQQWITSRLVRSELRLRALSLGLNPKTREWTTEARRAVKDGRPFGPRATREDLLSLLDEDPDPST